MMLPAPTLRTLERVFGLLAWTAFGLGAVAILGLCAAALLSQKAPPPEQFLTRLATILVATLVVTVVFRLLAGWFRRLRARQRSDTGDIARSVRLFDDSTLH